jgi:hypothetical protein
MVLEFFLLLMAKVQSSKFEVENSVVRIDLHYGNSRCGIFLCNKDCKRPWMESQRNQTSMTDEDWEDLDARALNTIHLCLADEVLFNIAEEVTTTGLWTKLESLYMTKNLSNRILLKRKLYSLQMKEGMKIVDHLNVFNTLICQLTSMEVKFEDEDKAVTLLCLFHESWDHLVTTMWFSTTYTIDYDTVVGALLSEEEKIQ